MGRSLRQRIERLEKLARDAQPAALTGPTPQVVTTFAQLQAAAASGAAVIQRGTVVAPFRIELAKVAR